MILVWFLQRHTLEKKTYDERNTNNSIATDVTDCSKISLRMWENETRGVTDFGFWSDHIEYGRVLKHWTGLVERIYLL